MISPFTCETLKEFDQLIVTELYITKEIQHRTSYHADGMTCNARLWSVCTAVLTPFSLSDHRQMPLGDSQCNLYPDCALLCQLEENNIGDNTNHRYPASFHILHLRTIISSRCVDPPAQELAEQKSSSEERVEQNQPVMRIQYYHLNLVVFCNALH